MAAGSLLALLDDIASLLDDVATLTKVAAEKTAGVLGDDLALNAEQVSGVSADRELPVIWAVAKGSFLNKLILVPLALIISHFAPIMVTILLMLGGAYLCFEGFEKVAHKFLHDGEEDKEHKKQLRQSIVDRTVSLLSLEKDKIRGAIRTDFILSAEIIVIALSTVANSPFLTKVGVVSSIAILVTVFIYGLVAGIVKIDDFGLHLMKHKGEDSSAHIVRNIGQKLLAFAPLLMRSLTFVGTLAMFLVGGSIIKHGIPALHHLNDAIMGYLMNLTVNNGILATILPILVDGILGFIVGATCVGGYTLISKMVFKRQH